MSLIEARYPLEEPVWDGGGTYHVIAWANGQKVIAYQEFGSYQGEWLMLTKGAETYYVFKDYYGSCSGCDSFQAADHPWTLSKAKKFAEDYKSFIEIPRSTMLGLIASGGLRRLFPANVASRNFVDADIDYDAFVADAAIAVKVEENLDISAGDILGCRNQEIKQAALRRFGYERFVAEANMHLIDTVGEDQLLQCDDIVFASVKDSTTDRRYLLRVPPTMLKLKQAIAWTFGLSEVDYRPLVET